MYGRYIRINSKNYKNPFICNFRYYNASSPSNCTRIPKTMDESN